MVVVHHNNSGTASSGQQTAAVSEDAVDEVQEQSLIPAETQPGTELHAPGAADRQREGASPVQERQEHKEKHPQMESVRKTQNVGTPKDADADMMALEEELENVFGRTQAGSNDPFHSDGNPISSGKSLKTSA
ncbi:hypothetical protein BaRGS_00011521 [Batillaria attramentaria]|uniref:Uncharacterized protein n=1 Tax=Batillaria attramentaria TaxID=370345 RepID=A0ABD0LD57_9CAEN